MQSHWYEDFFDQTLLDFWQSAIPAETIGQVCDFLERKFALPRAADILDIACGYGPHSLELARRGYTLTGVDLSPAFLAEAARRSSAERLPVTWTRESMHRISYSGEFDAAFCWGNSFGYLDPPATHEFIRAVAGALRPGATFILETGAVAESALPAFREDTWDALGRWIALERHSYTLAESRLDVRFLLIGDGSILIDRNYTQHVHSCGEIVRMLAAAGLETLDLYGTVDETPYGLGCRDMILVAKRVEAHKA
jgi:SAM-dependent methyltransferase